MHFKQIIHVTSMLLFAFAATVSSAASGCLSCHENQQKMQDLGFPHFVVTQLEVQAQTGMPADCNQCHLGNPEAVIKEEAHKGLARLQLVHKKGLTADITTPRSLPLAYGSDQTDRIYVAAMRDGKLSRDSSVAAIQWHDKTSDMLTQNFETMRKTCGSCHPAEFETFSTSVMANNAKQRQYKGWTDRKRGPHNCGPWFDGNFDLMQANTAVPMSQQSHKINQRACNTCHVGCLDCHFNPQPKNAKDQRLGAHSFAKTPPSLSCYGNGRASICHAGPEDRRRGAGYFGGSFSYPEGNQPDVHLQAKVGCLDCHESTKTNKALGHGTIVRQAEGSCVRCHAQAVKRHAASLHKKLTCEACHIQQVAGYQGTYWGPGKLGGADTPFFKFKAYYGIMPEPILLKDQKGRWIPVKPFPMAVMNQKESPFKPGFYWRYPANLPDRERTDDAWAYTGLHGGLPDNNKALTWIQMDKMSHKLGKARSCDSCHADLLTGSQTQKVTWEYTDPGAAPFKGSHTVVATKHSLKIKQIKALEPVEPEKGYSLSAFAPWLYLDVWEVAGDFSLPVPKDKAAYGIYKANLQKARRAHLIH